MTTDQRLEELERGLARARCFNRWLLAVLVVALGLYGLAWTGTGAAVAGKFRHGLTTFNSESSQEEQGEQLAREGQGPVLIGQAVFAEQFVLLDTGGQVRAVLGMMGDEPDLYLYNRDGRASLSLRELELFALRSH